MPGQTLELVFGDAQRCEIGYLLRVEALHLVVRQADKALMLGLLIRAAAGEQQRKDRGAHHGRASRKDDAEGHHAVPIALSMTPPPPGPSACWIALARAELCHTPKALLRS
jgi:hypothetical protein